MNPAFETLDKTKRDRIINAALEEFAKHGYDKASTNSIVKNAAISKGLLFHYFSNKQNLYNYLSDYAFGIIINTLDREIDWQEADLFNRLKHVWRIKAEVLLKYPYLAKFGEVILADKTRSEALALADNYRPNLLSDLYKKNIDFTKFKADIPIDKAINIMQWTLENIGEAYKPQLNETDAAFLAKVSNEVDIYLNLLKRAFYKEEAFDD